MARRGPIQVRVSDETRERWQAAADARSCALSELIRVAVEREIVSAPITYLTTQVTGDPWWRGNNA